jgi:hypothetical protein
VKEFWKQKLSSRKFWVAVASAAFIILSEGLGFNVDQELYWKLVALALGYIFGEAAVDIARAKNTNTPGINRGIYFFVSFKFRILRIYIESQKALWGKGFGN